MRCHAAVDDSRIFGRASGSGIYLNNAPLCDACYQLVDQLLTAFVKGEGLEVRYTLKIPEIAQQGAAG